MVPHIPWMHYICQGSAEACQDPLPIGQGKRVPEDNSCAAFLVQANVPVEGVLDQILLGRSALHAHSPLSAHLSDHSFSCSQGCPVGAVVE